MGRSLAFAIAVMLGATTMAAAQTSEEQAACQDDAFRLCSQTIPDRERTIPVHDRQQGCPVAGMPGGDCAIPARSDAAKDRSLEEGQGQGPLNLKPAVVR